MYIQFSNGEHTLAISKHRGGRFHAVILHGRECAWNSDEGFKNFVVSTLKSSGYDPEVFGLSDLSKS